GASPVWSMATTTYPWLASSSAIDVAEERSWHGAGVTTTTGWRPGETGANERELVRNCQLMASSRKPKAPLAAVPHSAATGSDRYGANARSSSEAPPGGCAAG